MIVVSVNCVSSLLAGMPWPKVISTNCLFNMLRLEVDRKTRRLRAEKQRQQMLTSTTVCWELKVIIRAKGGELRICTIIDTGQLVPLNEQFYIAQPLS